MFRPEDVDAFNQDVSSWSKKARQAMVSEMNALGIVHHEGSRSPVPAQQALKARVSKKDGTASRISFRMPRHLVFVHKGVGRGTKISQVGSTKRTAKPWFNPVVEQQLPELVDIVADHTGAMILNSIMIK